MPARYIANSNPPDRRGLAGFLRGLENRDKSEARPLIWTDTTSDESDEFIVHTWLHSGTGAMIDRIAVTEAALMSLDSDIFSAPSPSLNYENVRPGEAVKICSNHIIYDSDFSFTTDLVIERKGEGLLHLRARLGKDLDSGRVLLRDVGRTGE